MAKITVMKLFETRWESVVVDKGFDTLSRIFDDILDSELSDLNDDDVIKLEASESEITDVEREELETPFDEDDTENKATPMKTRSFMDLASSPSVPGTLSKSSCSGRTC